MTETTPGERLRQARRKEGITAEDLGKAAALLLDRPRPISASAVRNQENGTNGIPMAVARAYASILGVDPQWILFGDSNLSPDPSVRAEAEAEAKANRESWGGQDLSQRMRIATYGVISARWLPEMVKPTHREEDNDIWVWVPGWTESGVPLIAYEVLDDSLEPTYSRGTWLICAPTEDAYVWDGQHIIATRMRDDDWQLCVRELRVSPPDRIEFVGVGMNPLPTIVYAENGKKADPHLHIEEVVVASVNFVPGSAGPPLYLPPDDEKRRASRRPLSERAPGSRQQMLAEMATQSDEPEGDS